MSSIVVPVWSTSTLDGSDSSADREYANLSEHAQSCARARGPFFLVGCVADAANAFLAPRFMTTVLIFALFMGVTLVFL